MSYFAKSFVLAVCAAGSFCLPAQNLQKSPAPDAAEGVVEVVHVAGLTEIKPDVKGKFLISPGDVIFSTPSVHATIPRARILAVFVGDQRTEPWGTTGRIVRKVIPYGGGAALGAVSSGRVDLLTIESIDEHGGYHGAVFTVPFQKAAAIRNQLTAKLTAPAAMPLLSCGEGEEKPGSVLVAPIVVTGIALPDEYRILLYEQLFKQLKARDPQDSFLRAGDVAAGPGCTELTLHITVEGFKKGNRAVRASTGPLGMFLGTTSLSFEVDLHNVKDKNVFDAHMKKSDHSDSDSLGLADDIAKTVSKRIDKELKKRTPKTAAGMA